MLDNGGGREYIHTNSRRFDWAAQDDIVHEEFAILTHGDCFREEVNGQLTSGTLWPCQEVDVPKEF
jgi:hypothetical protein